MAVALSEAPAAASVPAVRAPRFGLGSCLLLALALRLVALAIPAIAHPDEIYQYLETAHRLVFGYGVVTWEWRYGMRSLALPLLVALPMRIGAWIAPHSGLYLLLPRLAMTVASLSTVAAAWIWGARIGRRHAMVAALVAATWYECVLFAPHILSETAAIALILPAAVLLTDAAARAPRRDAIAGALLAAAFVIRFQYAPAEAALAIACCRTDWRRRWAPLIAGGCAVLAAAALLDLAAGQPPFGWLVENIRLNLLHDRSAEFGTNGPLGYLLDIWARWSLFALAIVPLAVRGARRYPPLAWAAVVNFVFHSAVAHKEYRFVLLSAVLAVILAAIGSVDWAVRVPETAARRLRIVVAGWLLASLVLATGMPRTLWTSSGPELELYTALRDDPALCGVAVYRHNIFGTGSYAVLHRRVPIEVYTDREPGDRRRDLAAHAGEVDTVLAEPGHAAELPVGFGPWQCRGSGAARVCLYRRAGGCTDAAASPFTIQRVLARFDR